MNKRKTIICSFIVLSRILQYVCTTIGLDIYLPGYLQFGAITKKAGIYKIFFFGGYKFSFLWDKCQEHNHRVM